MNSKYSYLIICKNLSLFINYCWFYLRNSSFFLIKFIAQHVFRTKKQDRDIEQRVFNVSDGQREKDEPSNISFKFENQSPKMSTTNITTISNYRVLLQRGFCGFVEEPKTSTFQVHESFIGSAENLEKPALQSKDVILLKDHAIEEKWATGFEASSLDGKEVKESFNGFNSDSDSIDSTSLIDDCSVKSLVVDLESDGLLWERDFIDDEESLIDSTTAEVELMEDIEKLEEEIRETKTQSLSNLQIKSVDSRDDELPYSTNDSKDSDYLNVPYEEHMLENLGLNAEVIGDNSYHQIPSRVFKGYENRMIEEKSEGTESDDRKCFEHSNFVYGEYMQKNLDLNADSDITNGDHHVLGEDSEGYESKLSEGKTNESEWDDSKNLDCSNFVYEELVQENMHLNAHFDSTNGDHRYLKSDPNEYENTLRVEIFEETKVKDLDYDDLDESGCHQDLIEMLKLELKRARAGGLPTIFEESESPKSIEDFKPWKINEELLKEDPMDELHMLYMCYKERMRKLDVLNYQKMHAIGFLQLKNPFESIKNHKPLIPTMLSHLTQNLRTTFQQKSTISRSENFMEELQIDLETVYVGQTCLSWEFLNWQYEKVRELPNAHPYRNRQYNQVAGEFQQFQVTVQRFIENEPFQGPRLQNYVQNRCVLRNLLQVPVIKEDCKEDKLQEGRKGIDAITISMLEGIMEENIRLFWEFLKAEKDDTSIILKGLIRNHVELRDPSDFKLMSDIQASLQKKEKILKENVKIGNCLVKRFKKPREERSNRDIFFSQIDMKLIARVLKMSRITTEQLVWCHKKLSKITTEHRKIHREPSFLLFPC